MNLLECYILKIHSVEDVTEEAKAHGLDDSEPLLRVICDIDCYGTKECVTKLWRQAEDEKIMKDGFYLG